LNNQTRDENPVRILKDNKKETIDCFDGKPLFYKLYCGERKFPLTFKSIISNGHFDLFISTSIQKPNENAYDSYYTGDNIKIDIEREDLEILFLGIKPYNRLKMTFVALFASDRSEKVRPKTVFNPSREVALKKNKWKHKEAYEYFKEDMTRQEIEDMFYTI